MSDHLQGVRRIYLSGGEPLLRPDLPDVAERFRQHSVVGLPTNAMIHDRITSRLASTIDFVNVGIEGPRSVTTRVRGDYDDILGGIRRFMDLKVPLALCCVVMRSTVDAVPFVCQMGDMFGARKIKLVLPIRKGHALNLPVTEHLSDGEARDLFEQLREQKSRYGWCPKITLTVWTPAVEGYSLLVYPDGKVCAWPVYSAEDRVLLLGDLMKEDIRTIWSRDPFQANHFRKYLGDTIFVC